jgi:hypothetical protein
MVHVAASKHYQLDVVDIRVVAPCELPAPSRHAYNSRAPGRQSTKQAFIFSGLMLLMLLVGLALGSPLDAPPNLISWRRLEAHSAFCVLQPVALNSLLHNRMLSLIRRPFVGALAVSVW